MRHLEPNEGVLTEWPGRYGKNFFTLNLPSGSSDLFTVRTFLLGLITAALALGESYPSAWKYLAPDATAIVGIEWLHLRESFLADAVRSELSSSGNLGFPDLDCLWEAKEILLAGPDLLGVASGTFPASTVATQAVRLGMKPIDYDGVRIWIAPEKNGRSLAQVSDTLLLIGWRETLESAIDRSLLMTTGRQFSPLLARGARLAANFDLWITATALPDPLVKVFVPVEFESGDFDGGLAARNGLLLDARYSMATLEDAALSAAYFRDAVPGFHPLLRGLNVIEDGEAVRLKLQVTPQELAEYLRPPKIEPVEVKAEPPPPSKPLHVKILGLDDGPREFPLPAQ
jgi:hypothetical protein